MRVNTSLYSRRADFAGSIVQDAAPGHSLNPAHPEDHSMTSKHRIISLIAPLALITLVASCSSKTPDNATATPPATARSTSAPTAAPMPPRTTVSHQDNKLRHAAEPFEKLTETAFTASVSSLDAAIHDANLAAAGVKPVLAPAAAARLDAQLAAIKNARSAQDKASLAIASIEAYRVLVSGISPAARVPAAVSLLDYAGFRYDADLRATPVRWTDATQAADYASKTWQSLRPSISDMALRTDVDNAINQLGKSAASQDLSAAKSAATTELDLVDRLEKYFRTHGQ